MRGSRDLGLSAHQVACGRSSPGDFESVQSPHLQRAEGLPRRPRMSGAADAVRPSFAFIIRALNRLRLVTAREFLQHLVEFHPRVPAALTMTTTCLAPLATSSSGFPATGEKVGALPGRDCAPLFESVNTLNCVVCRRLNGLVGSKAGIDEVAKSLGETRTPG